MVRSSTRDSCRTNQNEGPHRRKVGRQRAAPVSQGERGQREVRGQEEEEAAGGGEHRKEKRQTGRGEAEAAASNRAWQGAELQTALKMAVENLKPGNNNGSVTGNNPLTRHESETDLKQRRPAGRRTCSSSGRGWRQRKRQK